MPNDYIDRTPHKPGPPVKGNLEYFFGDLLDTIRTGLSAKGGEGFPPSRIPWFIFGAIVHVPATLYNTLIDGIPFDAGNFIFKAVLFGFFFASLPKTGCFILILALIYACWFLINRPW